MPPWTVASPNCLHDSKGMTLHKCYPLPTLGDIHVTLMLACAMPEEQVPAMQSVKTLIGAVHVHLFEALAL